MKHTWTLLLAVLLLAFSLTACGGGDKQTNDQNNGNVTDNGTGNNAGHDGAANGDITDDGITNGGAANGNTGSNTDTGNGSAVVGGADDHNTSNGNGSSDANTNNNNGNSLIDDAEDALDDAGRALDGTLGGSAVKQSQGWHGTGFHQMLRNAQVHDTDGDLTDMENSVTPGSTKF